MESQERISLILEFASIAKKYMKIDIVHDNFEKKVKCKDCGKDLHNVEISTDGLQICPCGTDRYVTKTDATMSDFLKSVSPAKDYSDELNFRKTLRRFACGQKINFDINIVIAKLDRYFRSIGYLPYNYYRDAASFNDRGKKEGTSLKLLIEGLKATGLSKLYEDANYIGKHMWGWQIPDVLHLEEVIMNDYRITQKVYESIPISERDRKSSLSTQLRLYNHLKMRGVNVYLEDFKIPLQRESLTNQDKIWKYMCDNAGDPNIFYIPIL